MSSWVNNLRAFGRTANPIRSNQNAPPSRSNTSSPVTTYNPHLQPQHGGQAPASPSSVPSVAYQDPLLGNPSNKTPVFFREEYSSFIAKGNFSTLAMKPQLIEDGEWVAHQLAEQYRLMAGMIRIVQEVDPTKGRPLCNEQTCPTMSAGSVSYTWIDQNRNPMPLPAPTYIRHIQTWVNGKIMDTSLFPTDTFTSAPALPTPEQIAADTNYWLGKPSGFPQRFEVEIKNMYKQMFRCYAHLYWAHWLTFWDVNAYRDLNTCFVHFINVGRLYHLLSEKDAEPMQPLIEIWIKQGVLPRFEKAESTPVSAGGNSSAGPSAGTPISAQG
ncbi:hypothetical protein AMS68_007779 [Peltaster fructicola]|uniref:Mob1/phocein n=1 Tax=Peltaster fructicola TaxID=286661 RepID=A0A6H0Y5E4_9PEZI|nr:hypothetical protein AMS68_007779 [Peltaster fructicola]